MGAGRSVWVVLDLEAKKRGSLEEGLSALAARLRALRLDATFVFAAPPADWLAAALEEQRVHLRALDFRRPVGAAVEFGRWMLSARPDLVHFHFVRAHSPLVVAAHLAGARVVVHDHITLGQPVAPGLEHPPGVKRLLRPLKRMRAAAVDRFVDRRLAVSLFAAASVMDAEYFPSARIEVVPNGIDVERFSKADPMAIRWQLGLGNRPVVACVSRMAPEKGIDVLLRAVSRLPAETALLVAGDGPDGERCRGLAQELGVAERVFFLGLRDDVENVFAAADVVVMPSLWDEAFGLCVVEAMAVGRPVVVTDSGAMPELVDNGGCGVVVPRGEEGALTAALASLLGDRERAEALGAAARRRAVETYPVERWVDGVIAAYARALPGLDTIGRVIDFEPDGDLPATPTHSPRLPSMATMRSGRAGST